MKLQVPYSEINNNIEILEELFSSYSVVNRIERLYSIFKPEEVLFTSSFGNDAAFLLHLISRISPSQKVYYINTGYQFKETEEYKNTIIQLTNLEIVEILPEKVDHEFTTQKELWKIRPDKCCYLNKVKPIESFGKNFKVWISGLKKNQTKFRSSIKIFENKEDIIKFHPLFDKSAEDIKEYLEYFNLPAHPLKEQGYGSIGCTHCTERGVGREGRWSGTDKTECGLHFDVNL
jgi:phosphoadenosine phosphosulfate reductase